VVEAVEEGARAGAMASVAERLTPFMIFFCEYKDAVHAENPTAAPHEISRLIYERWKALSPEKARGYSILSANYTQQKKAPVVNRKKRERKERDPKAPKSATSAYMFFSKHHRMLLKQENADLSFGDLGKTVGAMWKAATPEEKRPFEELAAEDKVRYLGELSQYKALQSSQKLECEKDDPGDMADEALEEEPTKLPRPTLPAQHHLMLLHHPTDLSAAFQPLPLASPPLPLQSLPSDSPLSTDAGL
jgi:hypothetical protein